MNWENVAMNATCESVIGAHMESRFATMNDALTRAYGDANDNADECNEEGLDGLRESLLAFDVRRSVRLLFSTGGPADGVDLVLDDNGEILSGEYWYQDWFDGARRPLERDELDTVEAVYGPFPSV